MAINIQDIFKQIENGIPNLAQASVKNYATQAISDGHAILTSMKDDLTSWATQLANGQLKPSDFTDLVLGQKDELEMVALKQTALAAIQSDQFKLDLLNLIIKTVTAAL